MRYLHHILTIATLSSFASCAKDPENTQSSTKQSDSNGSAVVERYDEAKTLTVDSEFTQLKGSYSVQMDQSAESLFGETALSSSTVNFSDSKASIGERQFKVKFERAANSKAILEMWDGKAHLSGNLAGNADDFSLFVILKPGTESARSYQRIRFVKLKSE